jgi:aconitate decarboxylase
MTERITEKLATFLANVRFEDIPSSVIEHAKLCLLDTLGCGLFGSTLPWVAIVRDTVTEVDAGQTAALWGTDRRTSAPNAALVNGTAVHAFELDDLHARSIVHAGSVTVSAALAAAAQRPGRSGRDLLTATVVGYEAAARVGQSVGAAHLLQGWHPTGTHGAIGAAASAGRMLGLDPPALLHAIGTAGSHSSGLMAAQFSSMVKRLHAGHAAWSGVMSALLAARGFLGIDDLLENDYGGYLSTFSPKADVDLILAGLGEDWQLARVGFKPYSTNGSCHPTIDILLNMLAQGVRAESVERVVIHCSTATYKHVGWPYTPDTVTTAQMNLPYIVSVVLTDGDAFVDQFTPERISDPALVAFSRRVEVIPDPEIDAGGDPMRHATRVEVTLTDGRILRDSRTHAKGSAAHPLDASDVEAKFFKLAAKALPRDRAERVRDLVLTMETVDDLDTLQAALAG